MIKYAQDFYAFKEPRFGPFRKTVIHLRMVRRYRKGRKVQVMA